MNETDKERGAEEHNSSLAEALATFDEALRHGVDVDPAHLRELCARCESVKSLHHEMRRLSDHWPKWTRGPIAQGIMLSIARKNGDTRPFIALFMDMKQNAPEVALLPLQAWTIINTWFSEGGPKCGTDLPAWVWQYMAETAFNIQQLRASFNIAPVEKVKALPKALGFSGNGRNVFSADDASMITSVAALVYDSEGHKGVTGEARIRLVADAIGIADNRTARRYVAKGRRAQKTLPPWAK